MEHALLRCVQARLRDNKPARRETPCDSHGRLPSRWRSREIRSSRSRANRLLNSARFRCRRGRFRSLPSPRHSISSPDFFARPPAVRKTSGRESPFPFPTSSALETMLPPETSVPQTPHTLPCAHKSPLKLPMSTILYYSQFAISRTLRTVDSWQRIFSSGHRHDSTPELYHVSMSSKRMSMSQKRRTTSSPASAMWPTLDHLSHDCLASPSDHQFNQSIRSKSRPRYHRSNSSRRLRSRCVRSSLESQRSDAERKHPPLSRANSGFRTLRLASAET